MPIQNALLSTKQAKIFTSILVGAMLLTACTGEVQTIHGETDISNSAIVAEFELINMDGQTVTDENYEGKPMFVYYGFATCPDVCPAALSVMSATLNELGNKTDDIHTLFVTVDPERDTPEVLKDHLSYDTRIEGLSGSPEQVKAALNAMRVFTQKVEMDSALGYTMNHQSMFYVIDANGDTQLALLDTMAPKDIAKILKRFL